MGIIKKVELAAPLFTNRDGTKKAEIALFKPTQGPLKVKGGEDMHGRPTLKISVDGGEDIILVFYATEILAVTESSEMPLPLDFFKSGSNNLSF